MSLGEIAEKVGVHPRTLFEWRHSAEWQARWGQDIEQLKEMHRDELQAVLVAAVGAMKRHVTKDSYAALEVLHRMGTMPKPADVLKHIGGRPAISLDVKTRQQAEAQTAALLALDLARKALGRDTDGGVL
jgi:hypothetical protein